MRLFVKRQNRKLQKTAIKKIREQNLKFKIDGKSVSLVDQIDKELAKNKKQEVVKEKIEKIKKEKRKKPKKVRVKKKSIRRRGRTSSRRIRRK